MKTIVSACKWAAAGLVKSALRLVLPVAVISASLPASAQNANTTSFQAFQSGNWSGQANFYVRDDNFSHCTMNASYKSGISLFFAIDQKMQWRIGFHSDNWNFVPGSNYDIAYIVDNFQPNFATARAANKNLAVAELPANSSAFQQFRVGRLLTVRQGSSYFRFSLDGTALALSNLLTCASQGRLQTASAYRSLNSANPVSAAQAPAAVDAVPAEEKLEATRIVANILSSGELRDYKIMSSSEINDPSMPEQVKSAAVAWKSPTSIGLLHVIPASAANIDTLVAGVIGSDAEACKGTYASGKIPDPELPKARRVFTSCSTPNEKSNHIEYIFATRPNGMTYRFATAAFFEATQPKRENSGLRDAIKKAVFED